MCRGQDCRTCSGVSSEPDYSFGKLGTSLLFSQITSTLFMHSQLCYGPLRSLHPLVCSTRSGVCGPVSHGLCLTRTVFVTDRGGPDGHKVGSQKTVICWWRCRCCCIWSSDGGLCWAVHSVLEFGLIRCCIWSSDGGLWWAVHSVLGFCLIRCCIWSSDVDDDDVELNVLGCRVDILGTN